MKKMSQISAHFVALLLAVICLVGIHPLSASAASTPVKTDGTYYVIKNVGGGKVLNVSNNGSSNNTNVNLWENDYTSGVHWAVTKSGSNYVFYPQCATSKALNIYGDTAKSGSNICLWSKTGHSTQGWTLEAVSGGYLIRSTYNKNLVLTASGSKNGSNVCVQTYRKGNKYQIWTFSVYSSPRTTSASSTASLIWPLANGAGTVSSKAGVVRGGYVHVGTDISANAGTSILAVANGTVKATGYNSARGYYIEIEHTGGYLAVYQHMKSSAKVSTGSTVKQGQVIGYVGSTGDSSGPHLHFEIALTSSLKVSGTRPNYIYNNINLLGNKSATYYYVSRGSKSGSYYALNLTKV